MITNIQNHDIKSMLTDECINISPETIFFPCSKGCDFIQIRV